MSAPPSPNPALSRFRERSAEAAKHFSSLMRRSSSLESLWASLKTIAWLGPLTLGIWLYAEREQNKPVKDQQIPFKVRSKNQTTYIHVTLPDKNILVDMSGPQGQIEQIQQEILPRGDEPAVELVVPDYPSDTNPDSGHELDFAGLLRANPIFARTSVSIEKCQPEFLKFNADPFEDAEAEVRVPKGVTNLGGTPVFDPPRIHIRAPGKVIKEAATPLSGGLLVAEADLEKTGKLSVPGLYDVLAGVRLAAGPIGDEANAVEYTPKTVKASFEVRQSDVPMEYPSIALSVSGPLALLNDCTIECRPDQINGVTVIGPADKIAALKKDPSIRPRAILDLTGDDRSSVGQPPKLRALRFEMPDPSIRLSTNDGTHEVSFRIVERAPAPQ